ESVDDVDDDLESVRKSFSADGISFSTVQKLGELTAKEIPGTVVVLALNCQTRFFEGGEVLGVRSEHIELLDTRRMHTRHIQNRDVLIEASLGIYITPLTDFFSMVGALSVLVDITRKLLGQIGVDEVRLRVLVVSEYDLGRVLLCCVVDRQPRDVRQDLSCDEVLHP